jgi:heme/copper-type cytochrome/quinol oxidase subunit 3
MAEATISSPQNLPVGPIGRNGLGYWGVGTLVASEAALFAYLLFAYYYIGATSQHGWVLETQPPLKLALPNTILLLASSLVAWIGERGILDRNQGKALLGFGGAFVLGAIFIAIQGNEWAQKPFSLGTSSYASLYYLTTGFHMAHVIIGLGVLAALFLWTALDYFSPRRRLTISAGVIYWHFVDAVWLCVFFTYYITPYLGFGT